MKPVSATYLLDANALIALVISDHEHHDLSVRWAARVDEIALCPIVEGALIRFLVRAGEPHNTAVAVLSALYSSPRGAFWPASISSTAANFGHVIGHRQVNDAYLAALAASRGCRLATFDQALARALPNETELIHSRSRTRQKRRAIPRNTTHCQRCDRGRTRWRISRQAPVALTRGSIAWEMGLPDARAGLSRGARARRRYR